MSSIDRAYINAIDKGLVKVEQRADQIEAQLETLKAAIALLLLDNNMPIKAKQVRDL